MDLTRWSTGRLVLVMLGTVGLIAVAGFAIAVTIDVAHPGGMVGAAVGGALVPFMMELSRRRRCSGDERR